MKNYVINIIMIAWLTKRKKDKKNKNIQINMVFKKTSNKRQLSNHDTSKKKEKNIKEKKRKHRVTFFMV